MNDKDILYERFHQDKDIKDVPLCPNCGIVFNSIEIHYTDSGWIYGHIIYNIRSQNTETPYHFDSYDIGDMHNDKTIYGCSACGQRISSSNFPETYDRLKTLTRGQ